MSWDCNKVYHRYSYLELHLEIDSKSPFRMKSYGIRNYLNFPVVNFPFTCSNIPAEHAYGVYISQLIPTRDHCGSDHMVVGFTTICAISVYHHLSSEFELCSWRDVLYTTLCNKVSGTCDRSVVFYGYSGFLH